MRNRLLGSIVADAAGALVAALLVGILPAASQAQTATVTRTADGKPNLNGIWQAMNTAN